MFSSKPVEDEQPVRTYSPTIGEGTPVDAANNDDAPGDDAVVTSGHDSDADDDVALSGEIRVDDSSHHDDRNSDAASVSSGMSFEHVEHDPHDDIAEMLEIAGDLDVPITVHVEEKIF